MGDQSVSFVTDASARPEIRGLPRRVDNRQHMQ